jgi:hypothetical protein
LRIRNIPDPETGIEITLMENVARGSMKGIKIRVMHVMRAEASPSVGKICIAVPWLRSRSRKERQVSWLFRITNIDGRYE